MTNQQEPQSVNLRELSRKIHKKSKRRLLVKDVNKTLEYLMEVISEELDANEEIKLGKFMKLRLEERPEHIGYNGITKQPYRIPAKRLLKIKKLSELTAIENKDPKDN